jgi:hypothetical protein
MRPILRFQKSSSLRAVVAMHQPKLFQMDPNPLLSFADSPNPLTFVVGSYNAVRQY